jgi:hypothetical protein
MDMGKQVTMGMILDALVAAGFEYNDWGVWRSRLYWHGSQFDRDIGVYLDCAETLELCDSSEIIKDGFVQGAALKATTKVDREYFKSRVSALKNAKYRVMCEFNKHLGTPICANADEVVL